MPPPSRALRTVLPPAGPEADETTLQLAIFASHNDLTDLIACDPTLLTVDMMSVILDRIRRALDDRGLTDEPPI